MGSELFSGLLHRVKMGLTWATGVSTNVCVSVFPDLLVDVEFVPGSCQYLLLHTVDSTQPQNPHLVRLADTMSPVLPACPVGTQSVTLWKLGDKHDKEYSLEKIGWRSFRTFTK